MSNSTVLRVIPLKRSQLAGANSHQMRTQSGVHIDAERSVLNKVLVGSGNIEDDAMAIISRVDLASIKTTTVAAEMILTAHHEYFDRISPSWKTGEISAKMLEWIDKNLRFLAKEYDEGVASVTLHLDENAPHLHCVIVPVASYNIGFRRGQKEVKRINYRQLFADPPKVLSDARRNNSRDTDTKLGRLQTRYADAIDDPELTRGLRNSKATHKKMAEFQRLVQAPAVVKFNMSLSGVLKDGVTHLVFPDISGLKDRSDAQIKSLMADAVVAAQHALSAANKSVLDILYAKSKAHDLAVADAKRLTGVAKANDEKVVLMQRKITELSDEMALTKDEIAKLRAIDVPKVAEVLGYEGPMRWKNAIDMVKELEGMDYKNSVTWLHSEFGLDAAAATAADFQQQVVRTFIEQETPAVPLTKQQAVKALQVTKQLGALGVDRYRITMMSDLHPTYNVGKGKGREGTEEFYTAAEVAAMVPTLERKNMREKYAVFVTPISETQHFILVDDLTADTLAAMRRDGYKPNMLLESSKGDMQAVFVVDKEAMPKELGNAIFKGLNEQYGNRNIQGFVHPFRLAGFANFKNKHRDQVTQYYPFVRMIEQVKGVCDQLIEFGRLMAEQTAKPHITEDRAATKVRKMLMTQAAMHALARDTQAVAPVSLLSMAEMHYKWCEWRWGPNMSRSTADFMLAQHAAAKGFSEADIARALVLVLPDLATRYPDVMRHINETLSAAAETEGFGAPK